MANNLQLKIITPTRVMLDSPVDGVVMRTIDGDVGILSFHQPIITILDYGVLTVRLNGKQEKAALLGGFAEVKENVLNIFTDSAQWSDEIDELRAKRAAERAYNRLKEADENIDIIRAEIALKKALTRIKAKG